MNTTIRPTELAAVPLFGPLRDQASAIQFWNWTMMHEPATGGVIHDEVVTNPTPATVAMMVMNVPKLIVYERESMYSTPPFPGGYRKEDVVKVSAFLRAFADALDSGPNAPVSAGANHEKP